MKNIFKISVYNNTWGELFPIFTVYVTSLVERRNKEKEEFYKKVAQKPAPKADAS